MATPVNGPRRGVSPALALFVVEAVFWTQMPWVRRTNFGGFDEWTIHFLLSRRILDIPYANRPLELIWELPAAWLMPHTFLGYHVLYAIYMPLAAWMTFLLVRRVAPRATHLGLLAGVFVVVWAPMDLSRLGAVERTLYTGFTFVLLLSAFLWLESWWRRSWVLLALALVVAVVTARSYEGTIPLLLVTPLLALPLRGNRASLRTWSLIWEGTVGAVLAYAAASVLFPGAESYQTSVLGLDANPWHVLRRLAQQYVLHLLPLFRTSPGELWAAPVALAVLVLLLCAALAWRSAPEDGDASRRSLGWVLAAGFVLTLLGYGFVTLSAYLPMASRMQHLSAPGMGLFLAAAVWLLASYGGRFRRPLLAALAAWVVAVGTSRTLSLQRVWDVRSYFAAQSGALRAFTRLAPDLAPGTLVILLDEDRAWPATFPFRHAVEYLYQGRAVGYVFGSWDAMFPTRFEDTGVRCTPWPSVQRAWGSPAAVYPFDRTVVARQGAGTISILRMWPSELPPLPEGARYAPGERIVAGDPPAERAILDLR